MVDDAVVLGLLWEIEEGCRKHSCTPQDMSIDVEGDTLAALCRAWLAVDEAPIRMVGDGIRYGVSVAGTGMVNGQRVRIVKEPTEAPKPVFVRAADGTYYAFEKAQERGEYEEAREK